MSVQFSKDGAIGYVTLDRPPANSYESSFVEALGDAVRAAADDGDVRVVILRSANEKFFSAGADVKAFTERDPDGNMAMVTRAHEVLNAVAGIGKLFVAQIGGHALGGGLEIALACDLRFAAEGGYRIGLPEATLGLLPGTGGTQRLPRLIGPSRALDLMVSGRTLSPAEAHALGIVDRLVPPGELEQTVLEYARAIAGGAPLAVANIKAAVWKGLELPLDEALALEREHIAPLFASADGREGMQAFVEKRSPNFRGA